MNHIFSETFPNEVITDGYDRERATVRITVDITPRELNMLELALRRLGIEQMDNDLWDLLCGNLEESDLKDRKLNNESIYYMLTKVESWNNEVKNNGMDSD